MREKNQTWRDMGTFTTPRGQGPLRGSLTFVV